MDTAPRWEGRVMGGGSPERATLRSGYAVRAPRYGSAFSLAPPGRRLLSHSRSRPHPSPESARPAETNDSIRRFDLFSVYAQVQDAYVYVSVMLRARRGNMSRTARVAAARPSPGPSGAVLFP